VSQYCPTLYSTLWKGIQFQASTNYFFQEGSANCRCYSSDLSPPTVRDKDLTGARCFNNYCTGNQGFVDAYNLTDKNCAQYCDTVNGWLSSCDQATRSRNPYALDIGKFTRVCGAPKPPQGQPLFNYWVLIGGLVVIILASTFTFLLSKKIWPAVIVAVVLIALTIFLAIDFSGTASCQPPNQVCHSRITHIPLPNSWCPCGVGCQCTNFGTPCGQNGICISGYCAEPPQCPQGSQGSLGPQGFQCSQGPQGSM